MAIMQAGKPPNTTACCIEFFIVVMIESFLKTLIIAPGPIVFWTKGRQRGTDYMPNMKKVLKKSDLCKKKIIRYKV